LAIRRLVAGDFLSRHSAVVVIIQQRAIWTISSGLSGLMIAVVDSGPLYAAVDADDDDHIRCLELLEHPDLEVVVPATVVAEVTCLVGPRLGELVEAAFLRGLSAVEVEAPRTEDWPAAAGLVERYRDLPLDGTDASVAVLAERLETDIILTLDRRHFAAIRQSNGRAFRLLPD
jgi:predicted nucleic acid-binding protein